jgi:hypothetical protein
MWSHGGARGTPVADDAILNGKVVRVAEALVRCHTHEGRRDAAARGQRMQERSLERRDDHDSSEQGDPRERHSLPGTFPGDFFERATLRDCHPTVVREARAAAGLCVSGVHADFRCAAPTPSPELKACPCRSVVPPLPVNLCLSGSAAKRGPGVGQHPTSPVPVRQP